MVKLNINVPLINNGVYTVLPNVVASDEMSLFLAPGQQFKNVVVFLTLRAAV